MKSKVLIFSIIAMIAIILTGCADAVNVQECILPEQHVYGFWAGAWHGWIMGFSFVGSLFDSDIAVYAVNNNGAWYNFGFVGGFFFMIRAIGWFLTQLKK